MQTSIKYFHTSQKFPYAPFQKTPNPSNPKVTNILTCSLIDVIFLFNTPFFFFRNMKVPVAYGGSQTRGRIQAVAAGLHHSHRNTGSKLHLRTIPQLATTPSP